MSNRRGFLKNLSILTLGGLASQKVMASDETLQDDLSSQTSTTGKKQIGLQTYSLGQELLRDIPVGLKRLSGMGYTELEIFGYKEDKGKFGDYSQDNVIFISPLDYKKMADDAGLKITGSHLSPMLQEYTKGNMSKFDDFWKKATDIHAELGVSYMVQPSLPRVESEDDAKQVAEIFNRAGEIAKKAGILWGYHNHSNEFKCVGDSYIEELFLKNTDPENVMFELDVYWAVMGQQDPLEWMENYPNRFKLLHIKDRWEIGASGMLNFPNIFKKGYETGMIAYYVELEGDRKGRSQFEGVELSAGYLKKASFVK